MPKRTIERRLRPVYYGIDPKRPDHVHSVPVERGEKPGILSWAVITVILLLGADAVLWEGAFLTGLRDALESQAAVTRAWSESLWL